MKFLTLILISFVLTVSYWQAPQQQPSTDTPTEDANMIDANALLSINENCELPCFMGLVPGEATRQDLIESDFPDEITEQLREESFSMSDGTEIDNFTILFDESAFLSVDFVFDGNLLSRTQITGIEPHIWSEDEIILNLITLTEQFSVPQEALITIDGPDPANFVVTMIYDEPTILATIQFRFREPFYAENDLDDESNILKPLDFCFEYADMQRSQLWLFPEETPDPEDIVLPDLRRNGPFISNPNLNLFDLLGTSEEAFIDLMISPTEDRCVSGPSLSDLDEIGYVF